MTEATTLTKKERAARARAAILAAARRQFARHGFDHTTIRAVAAEADIDPSMVIRYYGSKHELFLAATDLDLAVPDLAAVPPAERGEVTIRHFLDLWEGPEADDLLQMLLASAANSPAAADRVRDVIEGGLQQAVMNAVDDDPAVARARAALVTSQILGLALCRYILRIPAAIELSRETIIAGLGPVLSGLLSQELP